MIRFRQIKGADSGREFEFNQELIRIGRMPDSDVNFDPEVDLDASGRHAEIRNEDGRYLLIDTGSRNGTWLNGHRIKHSALSSGDGASNATDAIVAGSSRSAQTIPKTPPNWEMSAIAAMAAHDEAGNPVKGWPAIQP